MRGASHPSHLSHLSHPPHLSHLSHLSHPSHRRTRRTLPDNPPDYRVAEGDGFEEQARSGDEIDDGA